jgi:hypothetical protein
MFGKIKGYRDIAEKAIKSAAQALDEATDEVVSRADAVRNRIAAEASEISDKATAVVRDARIAAAERLSPKDE